MRAPGRPPVYLEARKRVILELHPELIAQIDQHAQRVGQTRTTYVAQAAERKRQPSLFAEPAENGAKEGGEHD